MDGCDPLYIPNEALKDVQREISSLRPLGIETVKLRQSANGGLLLEPGPDSAQKVAALAARLRKILPEKSGVVVSRPIRRISFQIEGLVGIIR